MTDRCQLARQLAWIAQHLDSKGYLFVAPLRSAARALLEVPDDTEQEGCAGCATELMQPATGRRRRWCSERCRSRARRR